VSALALFVLVIGIVVGLAVIGGLGYLVHRRPALKTPVTVMLTATGILAAFVVGVLGITQASAQGPSAGPSVTESPSGR
jgi:protein-S-isoprenylcysteine O-methyltransferase Ste14